MSTAIELLAPARDVPTAMAAIRCGADAVYIGAPNFGARIAAGNTIQDVQQVVDFAHQYWAKVYVTMNTLLRDDELPLAQELIAQLYAIDVDGLIFQDVGLLELDLPPIPLIASTQMHNVTAEKVKFWQDVGITRVILARELTLDQIRDIRRQTSVELECFVHGALCVGLSGQCYMSYALGGRSGNRGQCAQPCRRSCSLKDRRGRTIVENRHLLSLKDMNRAEHLEALIEAGVTSIKIEGRLKDLPYVVNTVGFYRQRLDSILAEKRLHRSSSGTTRLDFEPNPHKTFNRGFTDYGLTGRAGDMGSIDTPKSRGEFVGIVKDADRMSFVLDRDAELHNADGICFFDERKELVGTLVNRVEDRRITPAEMKDIGPGREIYRNYDHAFSSKLSRVPTERRIDISMALAETTDGLELSCVDEDQNQVSVAITGPKQIARQSDRAHQTIAAQLTKLGNTPFRCTELRIETAEIYFLPVSQLNAARRDLIQRLLEIRRTNRPRRPSAVRKNAVPYPERRLSYLGNVLNAKALAFYRRHSVEQIEPAAESGLDMSGRVVMTTTYCLREQLGLCPGRGSRKPAESMILENPDGRRYDVHFRCGPCGMEILLRSSAIERLDRAMQPSRIFRKKPEQWRR